MAITRAKASSLLNLREMALYDDSRINGLRQLDARALGTRISRARTARDRARDLVQKHKLASRARTGSKRGTSGGDHQRSQDKAALLADILKRFETRLRDVEREARAPTRTTATRKTTRSSPKPPAETTTTPRRATRSTRTATTGNTGKAATRKAAVAGAVDAAPVKAASKRATRRQGAAANKDRPASSRRRSRITPAKALAQTNALLEAKQARDHDPKPWQEAPAAASAAQAPGFQSDAAQRRAVRLHAAESRLPAIHGSSSTRDRINQGKRDHRGDGD